MQLFLVFALAALLVGLSKGGLGGPLPVSLTAPLLSLVLPVSQAIGIILPLLIFADMFALYFYWKTWDMRYIRLMVPMAVLGIIVGTLLLATLPNTTLRRIVGLMTIIALVYKVASSQIKSFEYQPRNWHGRLVGGLAGFGSALANVGAPPFTAYMLLQKDTTPISFIGTSSLFFAIVNLLKLPGFITSGVLNVPLLLQMIWVLPLIPFGVWLGRRILRQMNATLFENIMLGGLFILSLWLLLG